MNKIKLLVLVSILMFALTFPFTSSFAEEPELGGGRISLIQGQVFIQTQDEGEWAEASVNFPIADGDRMMTDQDGRVELQFQNGTWVRVGESSQVDIIALSFDQRKTFIHLNQLEGRIYVNHRPLTGQNPSLYIDLSFGVLSSYAPSRFRVDLTPSEVRISVLEGSVEFKRDGRPIPIAQGKTLIVGEGGYAEVAQLYGRDEWDWWNETRDNELVQRRYAQRYLPPDLEPYGYEMVGNGRWVYTPEYLYVWVPTVVVGWTPFHYGYWAWRRGIYCWVPREPWGWVPFHYGRWVHLHNYGWTWVPPFRHATIWHPGAVAWHIGLAYVSWIPLAPGEIYYGHRYYGPHSLNIKRVNIDIQRNAYIHARIKDAVATVQRDSFFRRNPVRITHVENPFLKPVKVSGPPTEKPVFLERGNPPSRFIKESIGRVQPERKPLPKDRRRDIPSIERGPKVVEQKRITGSPEKRTISETARNRVERIEPPNRQTNPSQENLVRRESVPAPTKERVTEESKASKAEGNKSRSTPIAPPVMVKIPNHKEPKYSPTVSERNISRDVQRDRVERVGQPNAIKENLERRDPISLPPQDRRRVESPNQVTQSTQKNTSVNVNQNRFERTGQPNTFQGNIERNRSAFPTNQVQSLPNPQEGKVLMERLSLPKGGSFSTPDSRRPSAQQQGGIERGGILGGGFPGKYSR